MSPEFRRYLEAKQVQWAKNDTEVRAIFARREERLRAYDEYVAHRRARLRRLTFGLLGR